MSYPRGGWISNVVTLVGPEPLENRQSPIDYDHDVTRQLKPVADAILPFVHSDFQRLLDGQMQLF
ncbi:DNA polymerase II [compost metagenome]